LNNKNIIIGLIALYSGMIFNMCIIRIAFSLARHGHITWSDIYYPSKILLISTVFYIYTYLKKSTIDINTGIISFLIRLSPIRLAALIAASGLAFWQFGFIKTFILPFKILFLLW